MAHEDDLIGLGNLIADARDLVQMASDMALDLAGFLSEYDDPGWPAMCTLVDRLDAIRRMLAELPGDDIVGAIRAAEEYLDEMSDRADGQSY